MTDTVHLLNLCVHDAKWIEAEFDKIITNTKKRRKKMLTNKKLQHKPQGLGISTKIHTYITTIGTTSILQRTNMFARHILACVTWANRCNIPALLASTNATFQCYLGQQMQHSSVTWVNKCNIPVLLASNATSQTREMLIYMR